MMTAREPTHSGEMVPSILMEGNTTKVFNPEFFIVQLGHGTPTTNEFNILRVYDFPSLNSTRKPGMSECKGYIQKHKRDE